MASLNNIRNFCIIAHIDHGKTTFSDRILEITKSIDRRKFHAQMLDAMDLEQERGITIKAKAVRLAYASQGGGEYIFNLIDTPGHVDFSYEVAKSLAACEGAILLVDATQGVEAQTVANFYLALERDLKIFAVVNKIDLPNADTNRTVSQLKDIFGFKDDEILCASAKEGTGVGEVLEKVVHFFPAPREAPSAHFKGLVFDSSFDPYKGVILYVRVFEGTLRPNDTVSAVDSGKTYRVEEVGVFKPEMTSKEMLETGEVGFFCCNVKDPLEVSVPSTLTSEDHPEKTAVITYKKLPPMVFCGIFPANAADFHKLRTAIQKLHLSDPSFVYELDNLGTLGAGFRCGFLGLLHMEIVQERLSREYDLDLIATSPSVRYKVLLRCTGQEMDVECAHQLPEVQHIEKTEEPYMRVHLVIPIEAMEPVCELAKSRRGEFVQSNYLGKDRLTVDFNLPLADVVVDFYDKIKSITKGYGSLDYEFIGYRQTEVVKIDILINKKLSEAFSVLVFKGRAESRARQMVEKLKELIPRQMFEISIQAAIGAKIIASERLGALRKNVTAKCYGGDITRKRKLWEKQKEGKKKMQQMGNVQVPQEAFLEILKM